MAGHVPLTTSVHSLLLLNLHNGLRQKFGDLHALVEKRKPAILCLTEIGVVPSSENKVKEDLLRQVPGYSAWFGVRKCRGAETRGSSRGGVAILVRSDFAHYIDIKEEWKLSEEKIEGIALRVKDGPLSSVFDRLLLLYCSPDSPSSNFDRVLTQIAPLISNRTLLLGDFNAHSPVWSLTASGLRSNISGRSLLPFASAHGLHCLNPIFAHDLPTFHADHPDASVLDLFFMDRSDPVTSISIENFSNSDHSLCILKFQVEAANVVHAPQLRWNLSTADPASWADSLEKSKALAEFVLLCKRPAVTILGGKYTQQQLDDMGQQQRSLILCTKLCEVLTNSLHTLAMESIGKSRIQTRHPRPVFHTAAVKFASATLHRAQHFFRRYPRDPNARNALRVARLAYNDAVRQAHEDFVVRMNSRIEQTKDVKARGQIAWQAVAALRGTDKSKRSCPLISGCTTHAESAIALGQCFQETSAEPANANFDAAFKAEIEKWRSEHIAELVKEATIPREEDEAKILDEDISAEEVGEACKHMRPHKALGPDDIPPWCLHYASPALHEATAALFNFCLRNGIQPSQWKEAFIFPLWKQKGSASDPHNYRPISLLCVLGKLLDRILATRLSLYLEKKLSNCQHGFRRLHSTREPIALLHHAVLAAQRRGKHRSVCFVDIARAFDTVFQAGLLKRLEELGIKGRFWLWIHNFLTDRSFRVQYGDSLSSADAPFRLRAGTVQGSCISPILFLVYIDPLIQVIEAQHCSSQLFADDASVWGVSEGEAGDRELRNALAAMETWSSKWRLAFNTSKTVVLVFHSKRSAPAVASFSIHGTALEFVKTFRYLGVHFQQNGTWSHMTKTVISASHARSALLCSLVRYGRGPSPLAVVHLVTALVMSCITYGWPIWKPNSVGMYLLDSILVAPLRAAFASPATTASLALCAETGLLDVRSLFAQIAYNYAASQRLRADMKPLLRASLADRPSRADQLSLYGNLQFADTVFGLGAHAALPTHTSCCWSSDDFDKQKLRRFLFSALLNELAATPNGRLTKQAAPLSKLPREQSHPLYLHLDSPFVARLRGKLRMGWHFLNKALHFHGVQVPSPQCTFCNRAGKEESPEHIVSECTAFALEQATLSNALGAVMPRPFSPLSVSVLLGHVDERRKPIWSKAVAVRMYGNRAEDVPKRILSASGAFLLSLYQRKKF
jgi:hypothetical protein